STRHRSCRAASGRSQAARPARLPQPPRRHMPDTGTAPSTPAAFAARYRTLFCRLSPALAPPTGADGPQQHAGRGRQGHAAGPAPRPARPAGARRGGGPPPPPARPPPPFPPPPPLPPVEVEQVGSFVGSHVGVVVGSPGVVQFCWPSKEQVGVPPPSPAVV